MRILISACLLGARCRYDGVSKLQPWISDLAERHILVPVCPEQLGGLPTPRPPAERRGDRVMTRDGGDVTAQYRRGAEEALRLCRLLGCEAALLKERSPSCGSGMVYDGTFTGVLTAGEGVTAELLRAQGIPVYGESRVAELADRRGVSMTEISLAWLLTRVTAPVVGATKLHHIEGAAKAVDLTLTAEECTYLEELYTPPSAGGRHGPEHDCCSEKGPCLVYRQSDYLNNQRDYKKPQKGHSLQKGCPFCSCI